MRCRCGWIALLGGWWALATPLSAVRPPLFLHAGWRLQSSAKVTADGAAISRPGFSARGWYRITVPNTVVGALVANGTYRHPFFGMNLQSLPGMDYGHENVFAQQGGSNSVLFANQDYPADSPYRLPWWYRTDFRLPAADRGKTIWLHFRGLNYRANIWINGRRIASEKNVAGFYPAYAFNVTKAVRRRGPNGLAVEIFGPGKNDLGLTWVDWNPTPPDKDMGLWKPVYLDASGPVSLRHAFVDPRLNAALTAADLDVSARLTNVTGAPVTGVFEVRIAGRRARMPVTLAAGQSRTVILEAARHPQLHLAHPHLWWPYALGRPALYTARLRFTVRGQVSDRARVRFGIRSVTSALTPQGARLFTINGQPLLIRGAAWAPDMFLRWSRARIRAELDYARDMHLNALRFEGREAPSYLYSMADRRGLLIMPGWTCCDAWQHGKSWGPDQYRVARRSLVSEIRLLRNHPSVYAFFYGSDEPPPPKIERMYLAIFRQMRWPNPVVSSCDTTPSPLTGPSGVKESPYDYEPPIYWYGSVGFGIARGYDTEESPGVSIPPIESLRRFIPQDHLWPIGRYWTYHAGRFHFSNLDKFRNAMDRRYGKPNSLVGFEREAQAMNYESERAMFEAFGRNKYASTGVIQWMMDNAWPGLYWHLFDYYLVPAGAYFGTKKALEPVHVQYSYDRNSVAIVNSLQRSFPDAKVTAAIYGLDSHLLFRQTAMLSIPADGTLDTIQLPAPTAAMAPTYFLKLDLFSNSGRHLSDNFYWLSTKPDVMKPNLKASDSWVWMPQSHYADLTALRNLAPAKVAIHAVAIAPGDLRVELRNTGAHLAFMVHLRLATMGQGAEGGTDIVPIFWSDNYVSLLPGERRVLEARFAPGKLQRARLEVGGWNVKTSTRSVALKR